MYIKDITEIKREEGDVFINSLMTSITSALSHRLMDKDSLSRFGYYVEEYKDTNIKTPFNVFPIFDPTSRFINNSDTVAMVGFHWILTTLCSKLAKKVFVLDERYKTAIYRERGGKMVKISGN